MPTNTAAWINARRARLEVGPAPYTAPGDDQIVIRNYAARHQSARLDHPGRRQRRLPLAEVPDGAGIRRGGRGRRGRPSGDPVPGGRPGARSRGQQRQGQQHRRRGGLPAVHRRAGTDGRPDPGHDVLRGRRRPAARRLDRGLRAVPKRPASAQTPVGQRGADRRDSPGVGRLNKRGQQRHPAGGRSGLRGHHDGLPAELRIREDAGGLAGLRLPQPERCAGHHRGVRGAHAGGRDRFRYYVRPGVRADRGGVPEGQ